MNQNKKVDFLVLATAPLRCIVALAITCALMFYIIIGLIFLPNIVIAESKKAFIILWDFIKNGL